MLLIKEYIIVFVIVYSVFLFWTLRSILLQVKSPSKTLSWLLVVIFIPFVGIFLYRFLGRSIRKDKNFRKKRPFSNEANLPLKLENIQTNKHGIAKLLHKNKSASISYDNKVYLLKDYRQICDEFFKCIEEAEHYIHLDFYIVEEGRILDELCSILERKIEEGVIVRFLYDAFGSFNLSNSQKKEMRKKKIQLLEFMRFNVFNYLDYSNYRNHRKIIIVDGNVAFTGGFNISDNYLKDNTFLGEWHDTFIKVHGSAAKDFEKVFECDWAIANGKPYSHPPANNKFLHSATPVQLIASGPASAFKGIMHEYFAIITDANDYVYLSTPYFIPGESIMTALITSALSGVDVRIMLPLQSESKWLKWCMFSFFKELLRAGVRIFLYNNGFLHSKLIVSDNIISSIGTANVDERSFNTNFEINAVVYDEEIALELCAQFINDMEHCEELENESFAEREDRNRILESIARLASPVL